MIYEMGCTLTVEKTGIECNIILKLRKEGEKRGNWGWEKIYGRLDIGSDSGDWMHGEGKPLYLVKSAVVNSPDWTDPANWLVELYGVSARFIDQGIYGSGEGILNLTQEKLKWKMWSPYI
jgi:hypothetical protein